MFGMWTNSFPCVLTSFGCPEAPGPWMSTLPCNKHKRLASCDFYRFPAWQRNMQARVCHQMKTGMTTRRMETVPWLYYSLGSKWGSSRVMCMSGEATAATNCLRERRRRSQCLNWQLHSLMLFRLELIYIQQGLV